MCATEQRMCDARSKAERDTSAVVERKERPLPWRAGPVDLIQPRPAWRTLLLAKLVSLSRARVSSIAYVP
eukprot:241613-Prymnesium_polylepis.1